MKNEIKLLMEINPVVPEKDEKYDDYIQRIKNTRENKKYKCVYMERHHILPKSLGGGNEMSNLIYLLAQEHYYAHKLLCLENPSSHNMQVTWYLFTYKRAGKIRREIEVTADDYAFIRKAVKNSGALSHPWSEERKKHFMENFDYKKSGLSVPITEEGRKRLSELRKAKVGWKHSEKTKEKMSKTAKNRPKSASAITNMKKVQKNKWKQIEWEKTDLAIICLNTKIVYPNAHIASEDIGVSSRSISAAVNGETQTSGKDMFGNRLKWIKFKDFQSQYQETEYILRFTDDEKWEEEKKKLYQQGIRYLINISPQKGKPNKSKSKAVFCVTTNKKYSSLCEAAREENFSVASLWRALNRIQNFCGVTKEGEKMIWKYADEFISEQKGDL